MLMQLIWFCAAGYSFFLGGTILLAAVFLSRFQKRLWQKLVVYLLIIAAVFLIYLSATPLNYLFYGF